MTRQIVKQMQTGDFNPLSMNYFLMNWLFISPRDVVNASMLSTLLETVTPAEKQAILTDLFQGYDQRNIEAILDEVVPHFAFDFGRGADFFAGEEALAS